ncbi:MULTISPECIES: hypothetical protein [Leuconostoc]|nr:MULTISPECIES: hypothetical protein [Leuconostoc]
MTYLNFITATIPMFWGGVMMSVVFVLLIIGILWLLWNSMK